MKERRARTNRASDLRRECLRTYPACINKKAAERTEIGVKTDRAAHTEKESVHNVERVCRCESSLSGRHPLTLPLYVCVSALT